MNKKPQSTNEANEQLRAAWLELFNAYVKAFRIDIFVEWLERKLTR